MASFISSSVTGRLFAPSVDVTAGSVAFLSFWAYLSTSEPMAVAMPLQSSWSYVLAKSTAEPDAVMSPSMRTLTSESAMFTATAAPTAVLSPQVNPLAVVRLLPFCRAAIYTFASISASEPSM